LLEPAHDWLATLPRSFLHRDVAVMLLSEARKQTGPIFVKPAQGKVFEARVYQDPEELPGPEQIGDLQVLTSSPVSFVSEIRCFVLDGAVITASPYWRNGALAQAADGSWQFLENEEAEALGYAARVLQCPDISRPPAFVLDVGRTAEHGWAIIEGNPA